MHEMSIAEGLRAVIEEAARVHAFARVKRVRVEVGRFAGVETAALEFAYDVVMRNSPAEGSVLEIVKLPGMAHCFDCAQSVEIEERLSSCPDCGGARLMPESGDELRIKDMEVA